MGLIEVAEWVYLWVLAPLGLYALLRRPVSLLIQYLSLCDCIYAAVDANREKWPDASLKLPTLIGYLQQQHTFVSPIEGPGYRFYDTARYETWVVEESEATTFGWVSPQQGE